MRVEADLVIEYTYIHPRTQQPELVGHSREALLGSRRWDWTLACRWMAPVSKGLGGWGDCIDGRRQQYGGMRPVCDCTLKSARSTTVHCVSSERYKSFCSLTAERKHPAITTLHVGAIISGHRSYWLTANRPCSPSFPFPWNEETAWWWHKREVEDRNEIESKWEEKKKNK